MKFNSIYSLFVGFMVLLMASCDPIVDEQSLKNSTTLEGVELIANQTNPGSNQIELIMNTPGITGYWDYNVGKGFTDRVQFNYPILGKSTFTYVGTLGAEFFEKTIEVDVQQFDFPIDQDWIDLAGTTAAGKTWVFDGVPGDNTIWYAMSSPGNWQEIWWNAAGTCCPPPDAAGEMTFDLNGAANYTYVASPGAAPVKGKFDLKIGDQTISVSGGNILGDVAGQGGQNPSGVFNIIELTENRLVLHVPNAAWATGWTYIYKVKED